MQQNIMGQNIIITEPSSTLRSLGRNALAGKWKVAVLAYFICQLCLELPVLILNELFGTKMDLYEMGYGMNSAASVDMYNNLSGQSFLSAIYTILVTGAFTLGLAIFYLGLFRRKQVGIPDVFLGFEHFIKALGLIVFQSIFIILWTLLFIVPGIIAAIRYSQAFFILADDPQKGIRQCMNESKMLMKGNKAKYFCMSISFIGWLILAAIPVGMVSGIAAVLFSSGAVMIIASVIGMIFMAPVSAYMYSTQAGFYEILAGNLIKETQPAPVMPVN